MRNASIKASIMYIYLILKKYSDENHILTANQIINYLEEQYEITMDRRALYRNISALQGVGIDIAQYKNNGEGYYLISRDFEAFDVRLLCDAIASSDMLQSNESKEIIKKLINTLSIYEGRMLERTTYIKEDLPSKRSKIFYNTDILIMAITQGVKVSAEMLSLGYDNNLCSDGNGIVFSPYATIWVEGNYYVIAKDENDDELTHYRLDRLDKICLLERSADFYYGRIDINEYANRKIVNEGKTLINATLIVAKEKWEDLAETFKNAVVLGHDEKTVRVRVYATQKRLMKWVLGNIEYCDVDEPLQIKDELRRVVMEQYKRHFG